LRKHPNGIYTGVYTITERKINHPELSAITYGGLCLGFGKYSKTAALPPSQKHRNHFLAAHVLSSLACLIRYL
jgi:hypothetical protein